MTKRLEDMTAQERSAHTKRNRLSAKERAFSHRYAVSRNGVQSALAVYDTDSPVVAGSIASENLRKPKVRAEIEALLARNGVSLDEITAIHYRNARQERHLPTSQKAIGDFYSILGMTNHDAPNTSVQVAFIIEKGEGKSAPETTKG